MSEQHFVDVFATILQELLVECKCSVQLARGLTLTNPNHSIGNGSINVRWRQQNITSVSYVVLSSTNRRLEKLPRCRGLVGKSLCNGRRSHLRGAK